MISKMKECGIEEEKAIEMMRERIQKFEKACQAFKEIIGEFFLERINL